MYSYGTSAAPQCRCWGIIFSIDIFKEGNLIENLILFARIFSTIFRDKSVLNYRKRFVSFFFRFCLSDIYCFLFFVFLSFYIYIFRTRFGFREHDRLIVFQERTFTKYTGIGIPTAIEWNANDEGSFYFTRLTQTFAVIATINYRHPTDIFFFKIISPDLPKIICCEKTKSWLISIRIKTRFTCSFNDPNKTQVMNK